MTVADEFSSSSVAPAPLIKVGSPAVETGGNEDDPSIPSAAYLRMEPRWTKCRACMIGTEAIRAGRTSYLIQYEGESVARYNVRLMLAAFYNGFARTVLASVGLILSEEPALGEDMPPKIVDLWENIDASGTHGTVFCRRLLTTGIVDSYAGILVEHTRKPTGAKLSGDEEKRLGMRPYFLLFKADDVIRALYEPVNGVRTLTLLILREVINERVGQFGVRTVTQYRVYTNTAGKIEYQLWKTPDTTGSRPALAEPATAISNQTEIPWSPFVAGDEVTDGEYKPALIDLADLNIQYHNTLTNNLSLQSLAYIPTPVRVGAMPNDDGDYPELVLGPRNTIEAPATEGVSIPVYWLSPPVDVLDAGERTLTSTKADMGTMGAAFLSAETRAAETAEGKRIDSAASRATLATVSRALKDTLERAFGFLGNYLKVEAGSVTLNDNFTGEGLDPQQTANMVTSYQAGAITIQELRHYLATGQLPETFDANDIEAVLKQNAVRDPAPVPDPQTDPAVA